MLDKALRQVKIVITLLTLLTLLTGLMYPALVTGLAQLLFPWKANGSLIQHNGHIVGSVLIGQSFSDPRYFWARPSATPSHPYNASQSSGSNMAITSPAYADLVRERINLLKQWSPQPIPVDLITASGSGLDPDISPLAAFYQIPRIAKYRQLSTQQLQQLVKQHIKKPVLGLFGEPRVNVLELNLALNEL